MHHPERVGRPLSQPFANPGQREVVELVPALGGVEDSFLVSFFNPYAIQTVTEAMVRASLPTHAGGAGPDRRRAQSP